MQLIFHVVKNKSSFNEFLTALSKSSVTGSVHNVIILGEGGLGGVGRDVLDYAGGVGCPEVGKN